MRFALTEEQVEFSEAVRGLLENTCAPDDVRSAWNDAELAGGGSADASGRVPAAWSALGEMGVLGIMAPESSGGLGMTDEDLSPLLVEAGRVALPDPLGATAGVAVGALRTILDQRSDDRVADLLGRISAGSASVGVLFGADAGSSVAGSDLISSASTIDELLVFDQDSVELVDRGSFEFESVVSVDGARDLAKIIRVDGDVIATGDLARGVTVTAFDRAALYASAELVGLSERMVEMAVAYAAERQQFGVPIGSFQAVKHHLANAAMRVEFAKPLVMRAAHSISHSSPDASQHVSMAKARASQASDGAARASLQVHGGIGYTVECDLHLFMKRAWALSREFGDARFHTTRVKRALSL